MADDNTMPWYQSHKKVRASKITELGAFNPSLQYFMTEDGAIQVPFSATQPPISPVQVGWYLVQDEGGRFTAEMPENFENSYEEIAV